ncbi:hypothetical protein [Promicromonospora sp. NFX87]|uniref:hypothetical protein n=1 Tax=Promicromonospora sp. NFX87 TaxID=3402691 RepID=UPI003AFA5090
MLLVTAVLLSNAPIASADGPAPGADLHVAQSLGDRELTVVLRRVDAVPGPLRVDVVTHVGSPPGQLRLRLSPTGASTTPSTGHAASASEATVRLGSTPGTYGGTLRVQQPGPQELLVDDGSTVASIPFVVPVAVMSPAEKMAYAGFAAAGLLLAAALVAAATARQSWLVAVPACGVVAALAVAICAAVLSASTPAPPVAGQDIDATVETVLDPYSVPHPAPGQASRPPVTMVVHSEAAAGGPAEVALFLTDGSSGRPVDDLLVHDSAFVHLLVVTPSMTLRHLHPVRVAPGEYRVRLADPEPGHYALAAEVVRRGGGVQLLRSPIGFDIAGTDLGPGHRPAGPGVRDAAGTSVHVSVTGARSGEPTTIVARFGDQADLQPWLGMVGHLIAVGPLAGSESTKAVERAPTWAHVHAMPPRAQGSAAGGSDAGQPDETVGTYGPEASFTHTFPLPGRYRVWVQAQRDYRLLTVPVTVDIAAGPVSGR